MRVLAPAALLFALAACGEKPGTNDAITVQNDGSDANAAPASVTPAEAHGQDFVATVMGALAFETQSAKLAAAKAGREDVRAYAQALGTALESASRDLVVLAARNGLETTPRADATSQSDLALLSSTQGAPLDLAYLDQRQAALTDLLGTVRAYKNGGDNPLLQGWADTNQAVIAEELNKAQTLKAVVNDAMNGE